ncbi:hypothetical protein SAMN04490357_0073 [Streptomyces misionensis]|uniref:Uncharacterized protein n=1 Tax=Streptomyces misionensis TaxID=67331 RepID=A0A1H4IBV6_9ACTN|nr:hypothetical protein [Streptomyces misionensis]SEB30752.1 hypothetical protein SAMN04490357_0073 [Streptomyces misionensis]
MSTDSGALLHRTHPWIGRAVTDTATGRRGTLRAVAPSTRSPTRRPSHLTPTRGPEPRR